jgi:ComF family protein
MAKELVGRLKFYGAQAAAKQMTARLLPVLPAEALIVPVPTANKRVRGRGYDQAKLLARELSRQSRLPYLDCLVRSGHTHQVGSSRQQRQQQLRGAFRIIDPAKIRGCCILLVDDVVTTGATLEAAAQTLGIAGADRIEAAVFCAA